MFVVDRHVFERTASDAVIAGFWIRIGNDSFPAAGWDDFASRVLAWFIQAILRLLKSASRYEMVSFMGGPYRVELRPLENAQVAIRAVEDGREPIVVRHETQTGIRDLAENLLKAGQELLGWCEDSGWVSKDEAELKQALEELRSELQPHARDA